jgi:Fuc2NAc and GlcNAc transferase
MYRQTGQPQMLNFGMMSGDVALALVVLSFGIALLSVGFLKHYLQRYVLDVPNERSSHSQPTPRGGGLGFILAFVLTVAIAQFLPSPLISPHQSLLWLALIPLVAIGALDDWQGVRASVRYLVQFIVSVWVVVQCGAFPLPGLSEWGTMGEVAAMLFTIVGMTAAIDFYNFMDGLDGLVASVSAVQLGFLALWFDEPALWLLVAALAGFLYWNWSPARVFMGDVGSTFLGAAIAIAFLSAHSTPLRTVAAVAVTFPLMGDATYTLIRRLLRQENIFQAHRTHLYQRLQQAGWSHEQVAAVYLVFTLLAASSVYGWELWGAGIALVGAIAAIIVGEWYLSAKVPPTNNQSQT